MIVSPFRATLKVSYKQEFSGGIMPVVKKNLFPVMWFFLMVPLWSFIGEHGSSETTTAQFLTYTLMSTVFTKQLNILTPATSSLWEGSIIGRYMRPMHVFASFIAETIGKQWIPTFFVCLYLY